MLTEDVPSDTEAAPTDIVGSPSSSVIVITAEASEIVAPLLTFDRSIPNASVPSGTLSASILIDMVFDVSPGLNQRTSSGGVITS